MLQASKAIAHSVRSTASNSPGGGSHFLHMGYGKGKRAWVMDGVKGGFYRRMHNGRRFICGA